MEDNISEKYAKELYDIKENIKNKLKHLDNGNYATILTTEFGYKRVIIESIESIHPERAIYNKKEYEGLRKKVNDKIPNESSGIYIFKENSEDYIYNKWVEFSKGRRIPKPKDKLNKEKNKYDQHIFYIGRSNELSSRTMEHIGGRTFKGNDEGEWLTAYSLKLSDFIKQNTEFKCQVEVFYKEKNEDYDYIILNTIVESILHDKLKPKLGSGRS